MDGNWQPYSIRFIFQILLRAVAKQNFGYPILWIFLDLPLRTLLPVGRLPAFMSTILLSFSKNRTGLGNRRWKPRLFSCATQDHTQTDFHSFWHLLLQIFQKSLVWSFEPNRFSVQKRMYRVCSMCHMKKLRNLLNSIKEARKTALHAGVPWRFGWLLFTCTSQFVPWLLQKKKTHFTNTSWLLQKSSKKKMTSK